MKKSLFAVLLLVFLVLCGCVNDSGEDPSTTSVSTTPVTQPPESPVSIMTKTDGAMIGLAGNESFCSAMVQLKDGRVQLSVLEVPTGEVLAQKLLLSPDFSFICFQNRLALMSRNSLDLYIYSPNLEAVFHRSGKDLICGELSSDGFFYGITRDDCLLRISLEDGAQHLAVLPEGIHPAYIAAATSQQCLLDYTEGDDSKEDGNMRSGWFDLETGKLLDSQSANHLSRLFVQPYYDYQTDTSTYLRNAVGDEIYVLPEPGLQLITSTETLALFQDEHSELVRWDLEAGTVFKRPAHEVYQAAICGNFTVFTELEKRSILWIWDSALSSPESVTPAKMSRSQLEETNQKQAASLERQSGFSLHYGEEGAAYMETIDTGYASDSLHDPLIIHLALENTAQLAKELPQDFFRELSMDGCDTLDIYFTGTIHPTHSTSVSDSVAFVTNTGTGSILVADISSAVTGNHFRSTLVHELMHIMENRIIQCSVDTGIPYLNYWFSFLPDPAPYFYSYHDEEGLPISDTDYTPLSNLPREEVLFVDPYSRTFPHEDRARLLENLYLGADGSNAEILQTGIMAEKSRYLCAVIRECFPCCKNQEQLPWEVIVDTVPFSHFEERVMSYEMSAAG